MIYIDPEIFVEFKDYCFVCIRYCNQYGDSVVDYEIDTDDDTSIEWNEFRNFPFDKVEAYERKLGIKY